MWNLFKVSNNDTRTTSWSGLSIFDFEQVNTDLVISNVITNVLFMVLGKYFARFSCFLQCDWYPWSKKPIRIQEAGFFRVILEIVKIENWEENKIILNFLQKGSMTLLLLLPSFEINRGESFLFWVFFLVIFIQNNVRNFSC